MVQRDRRKSRQTKQLKKRYAVFTEGLVTESQYLEMLLKHLRPRHATFSIKPIGKDPSRVLTEYRKAKQRGDFDRAILVVDVDQHHKLDTVLRECRSSTAVDAIVTNPWSYGCSGMPPTDEGMQKHANASGLHAATIS